jgi:hypothetical protein
MFSRIHNKLGSAGLIVAVIALVAALAGTAIAAAKLNGTQKKETEKIAKKWAKKIPGPAGPAGPKGDAGPAGAKGDSGSKGDSGAPGSKGDSVVTGILSSGEGGCTEGGITVEVEGSGDELPVCNGEAGQAGSPWVADAAPSGTVMKGTWVLPPADATAGGEEFYVPVSTAVPINQQAENPETGELGPMFVFPGEAPFCLGSAEDPEPPPFAGAICMYTATGTNISGGQLNQNSKLRESGGGMIASFKSVAAGTVSGYGSWAMKTP